MKCQRAWIENLLHFTLFQVSSLICGFFRLCQTGKEAQVQEQISRLPTAKVGQSKQNANECSGMDEVSMNYEKDENTHFKKPKRYHVVK